jgi:alpha-amylase/alpha-mannosidase (GH57 family)
MEKYVCIHGHFYQPPRENAWLEEIEQQDSAYPYHDWNERIAHECYGPNGTSRILDEEDNIINIVNNYERISFNFGPTLLQWMKIHTPETYQRILDADAKSQKKFGGHGNAIAQVYNHIIMPLASRRDKETQVIWGIRDFESRFNRKPEGMWLAETAVDTETLEVLAENNIRFTLLAPRQASRVKSPDSNWTDVSDEKVDTTRPYTCKLPSGKSIVLFFYDGSISQDIAFKGLLIDGKEFAKRLVNRPMSAGKKLIHVATDGESYGHHHRHGDMALAYCLDFIEQNNLATITNYGQFIDLVPVTWEVEIFQNSSWSCAHGVERWRSNCGCNSGMHPSWNQEWRAPLRNALDWLNLQLASVFEKEIGRYMLDPWNARNNYVEVVLNRKDATLNEFLGKHCKAIPEGTHLTRVIRLLEMQRHALLMFTSCGWFFDELSGIETIQILQYADRAIQLAESESSIVLEKEFLQRLQSAPSNLPEYKNGSIIQTKVVQPSRLTLSRVGAHYAVASLFEDLPENMQICNYRAENEKYIRIDAGTLRLAIGKTHVFSLITQSVKQFYFAVVWLGQNHIIGNSSSFIEEYDFKQMQIEITEAFNNSQIAEVIGIMQIYFGPEKFSLWNLFKDQQRKVLNQIVKKDVMQAEESFRAVFNRNYNIMSVMSDARLPIPSALVKNLENVINTDLRHVFENGNVFTARLDQLAQDAQKWNVKLDKTTIGFAASQKLHLMIHSLQLNESDIKLLDTMIRIFEVMKKLEISMNLVEFQNAYFSLGISLLRNEQVLFCKQQLQKLDWIQKFISIGYFSQVKLPRNLEELL